MKQLAVLATLALLVITSPANAGGGIVCPASSISTYVPIDTPTNFLVADMDDNTPHADLSQPLNLPRGKYTAHAAVLVQQPDGSKQAAILLCSTSQQSHDRIGLLVVAVILIMADLLIGLKLTSHKDVEVEKQP